MGRGRPKKDKFSDLDEDYKNAVASMDTDAIKRKICEVAMNQEELMTAKSEDQDLAEKVGQAKEAGTIYREGSKMNRLRTQYAMRVLEDRGTTVKLEVVK